MAVCRVFSYEEEHRCYFGHIGLGVELKHSAQLLALAVFSSVIIGGCASTDDSAVSVSNVRSLTYASARSCRLIGDVSVVSPADFDGDHLSAALSQARVAVAKVGGNGLLVRIMSTKTSQQPSRPSRYSIQGQAYSCT